MLIALLLSLNPYAAWARGDLRFEGLARNIEQGGGRVGAYIYDLRRGEVVYGKNETAAFAPASLVKLVTTIDALEALGSDYCFKTAVYRDGALDKGTVEGNLILKGFGDPTLTTKRLHELAESIVKAGITRVKGNLIYDTTLFTEGTPQGWPVNQQANPSMSPFGPLSLNYNTVIVRVKGTSQGRAEVITDPPGTCIRLVNRTGTGTSLRITYAHPDGLTVTGRIEPGKTQSMLAAVPCPGPYTASILKKMLEEKGVTFDGSLKNGTAPEHASCVAEVRSAPLIEILRVMNNCSNNFMAEQIYRTIKAQKNIPLYACGVDLARGDKKRIVADGSGLSAKNRLSPRQIGHILNHIYSRSDLKEAFLNTLSGLKESPIYRQWGVNSEGLENIKIKSGRLPGIYTMAGIVCEEGREVLYVWMIERPVITNADIRYVTEECLRLLCKRQCKE